MWLHNFPETDSAFSCFQALGANFQIKTQHDNSLNASCSLISCTRESRHWICGTGQGVGRGKSAVGTMLCVWSAGQGHSAPCWALAKQLNIAE